MGFALLGIGIFAYVDGKDFNELVDQAMEKLNSDFTIGLYGGYSSDSNPFLIIFQSFFQQCKASIGVLKILRGILLALVDILLLNAA